MTLSVAWVRSVGATMELVFATDSRLRCGRAWDVGPKILTLPRSDCAICAGDTDDAYPLMLHMASAIADYPKSRRRAMDTHDLKGHTLRVFNHLRTSLPTCPEVGEQWNPRRSVLYSGVTLGGKRGLLSGFCTSIIAYANHIQSRFNLAW
jgi:hypothetical protein